MADLCSNVLNLTWQQAVMWVIGGVLIFLAIKKDIDDNFNSNKCEDVVKRALIDSPVFQKCVEEELKKLKIEYKV